MPLLAEKFEEAWPIKIYLKRYLRKKVSEINAENSRQVLKEEWDSEDRSVRELDNQDGDSERRADQERGSPGKGKQASDYPSRFTSPVNHLFTETWLSSTLLIQPLTSGHCSQ